MATKIAPIVIFARQDDLHCFAVAKLLRDRHGVEAQVVDLSHYPQSPGRETTEYITVSWCADGPRIHLTWPDITIGKGTVVWWRRPQAFSVPTSVTDPELRRFALAEWKTTVDGALVAVGAKVVNDIYAQRKANNKILQLTTAARVGFSVPSTVVSNSMVAITEFEDERGASKCIYKPQTHSKYHVADTRILDEEFRKRERRLAIAPVIVQEFIPVAFDLRVNVIGDRIFATRIPTASHDGLVDWRLAVGIEGTPIDLRPELADRCSRLVRELDLDWGAIDIRVKPNGEEVFFEVNPSGQFLFCEHDAGLELTDAFCSMLLTKRGSAPS